MLDTMNLAFTVIFTLELVINLCAHWLRDFVCNSWSPPALSAARALCPLHAR